MTDALKTMPDYTPEQRAAFWQQVAQEPDGCWLWQGHTRRGYGSFGHHARRRAAHRVAYYLHYGTDPIGTMVCHSCDVERCCNPAHLFLGTATDNVVDMMQKGRHHAQSGDKHYTRRHPEWRAYGERNGHSKLTGDDVGAIRQRYSAGGSTQQALADEYGVSRETIRDTVYGKLWPHITTDGVQVHPKQRRHGSAVATSKLTEDSVRAMRAARTAGVPTREIALRYGVAESCARSVIARRSWKHVP